MLLNSIDDYPKSGLGRITTATNQDVHEVLNGDYTFSFEMLVTDKLFSKLKEEMIIATSVSVKDTDFFYVKTIDTKNPGTVTVTCNHVTMLTNENYVRGKLSIDGKTVKSVISELVSRLDLPGQSFSYLTDIDQTIGKTDIVYTNSNPGQILIGDTNSLVSVLDARLVRKGMTLKLTNKNTGHYIDLRRGKNIAGVSINRNIDNLTTSIVPYFNMKSKEVNTSGNNNTPTNNGGWTIKRVDDGIVEVTVDYASIYTDSNTMINNQKLGRGSSWKTDEVRSQSGVTQYHVGTNQWLLGTEIHLTQGSIGEVISNPSTSVKPSDTVPAEQLQYGPEVYSPYYSKYKLPHRKYVDYSSRVENIPDLIDISSRYFIENYKIDKPVYTINIDVANANQKRVVNAQVGDIARIYDPIYHLESNETIIERTFDPDLNSNKSLKAGVFQQTIFRYLDKRIKDSSQKVDDVKVQTNSSIGGVQENVDGVRNDVNGVRTDMTNSDKDLKNQMDNAHKQAEQDIANVKSDVSRNQTTMTNFMNSGGNNVIRWIPSLAEATQMEINTGYGYLLIDDHGMGFHKSDGTVITGMSADGRFMADSIVGNSLTGTTITGGTITGGTMRGTVVTGAALEATDSIHFGTSGNVTTSMTSYGISTDGLTVNHIEGVKNLFTANLAVTNTATIKYLVIPSGGNISNDGGGLYLQGPVYVDGRRI